MTRYIAVEIEQCLQSLEKLEKLEESLVELSEPVKKVCEKDEGVREQLQTLLYGFERLSSALSTRLWRLEKELQERVTQARSQGRHWRF